MNNTPYINSRGIKNYIDYVKNTYPEIEIYSLLKHAGIGVHELEDQGHLLNQLQIDRFHDILVEKTKNPNISRDAGRFAVQSGSFKILRQYFLGFLSPSMGYAALQKLSSHITHGHTFKSKPLKDNIYEIIVTPNPSINEKPYQCENRIGTLEAMAKAFTNKWPIIEHSTCIHKGDNCCKYIITWEKTTQFYLRKIRNYISLIGFLLILPLSFIIPHIYSAILFLLIIIFILAISYHSEHLDKKELSINMEKEGSAAEQLLSQMNMRYNEALLIQEIGQATSMILESDKLLLYIMEALEKRLDFDRGGIMLANKHKTGLHYAAGYGYKSEFEGYLRSTEFHLNNPLSRGPLVEVFHKKTPIIVNDISEIAPQLSPRSQEFAKTLGAESFVCVPIIYERESMGVLLVDNIKSKRRLSQSDVNLLMGIAPQVAISLNNAISYQKIQESEERFRSLSENAPDIIYTLNAEGVFTHINPAWERILGHKKEEVIGKHLIDFIREEDSAYYLSILEHIRKKKETVRDIIGIFLHKDGSEKFFNLSGAPNMGADGKVTGIVGTFKDITELKNSEESYRLFINGTDDMAFLKDSELRYIFINQAVANFFDKDESNIIGKTDFELLSESIANTYKKTDDLALNSDGVILVEEIINQRIYEIRKFRIKLIDGQMGVGAYMRDITQQREMESRLMQAQKMEAIGTLAGGIAHDFNNLLMGIQGYTSLLLMDLNDRHPYFERVKSIQDQVESGADLTKQLLGFARQGRYEVKPSNINQLLKKSSSMFGRTKKEIGIHEDFQRDVWAVDIDQGQIEQVLLNLYVNAWQAMPGGGDIYLRTENVVWADQHFDSLDVKAGRYVKISVADTGVGMDEETRRRIFEPFFTTKEMGRGTGLGLATVYGIIKGHTGFIDVSSEPGHGSCFMLYLPASDNEVVEETQPEETVLPGQETILLVDDEETILEVTQEILESLGYTVLTATSGYEAIEIYKKEQNRIDLMILDMIMPGMGGGETYDVLKTINPEARIILSSGYSIDGQAKAIMERGVKAFLQKPFRIHQLSQKVREALDS
ncbi:MAG: PAS domain S-box protein [Deltaproteobacteria bacterium]|nr:PAS domain S-box protein [Deltaproteobacteria bacterium]